jgi:hypothetical protein
VGGWGKSVFFCNWQMSSKICKLFLEKNDIFFGNLFDKLFENIAQILEFTLRLAVKTGM